MDMYVLYDGRTTFKRIGGQHGYTLEITMLVWLEFGVILILHYIFINISTSC